MKRWLLGAVTVALVALMAATAEAHVLTYGQAKRVALQRGERFAQQPVQLGSMFRYTPHKWSARVEWQKTVPDVCEGCDYNPDTDTFSDTYGEKTENCAVTMIVRFAGRTSRQVRVSLEDSYCF